MRSSSRCSRCTGSKPFRSSCASPFDDPFTPLSGGGEARILSLSNEGRALDPFLLEVSEVGEAMVRRGRACKRLLLEYKRY